MTRVRCMRWPARRCWKTQMRMTRRPSGNRIRPAAKVPIKNFLPSEISSMKPIDANRAKVPTVALITFLNSSEPTPIRPLS